MKFIDGLTESGRGCLWDTTDWNELEARLLNMQCKICKAVYNRDNEARIDWQTRLVRSLDAKMLAVRHVCESSATPGIDGVKWNTSAERMQAALSLTSRD
ncbi:MAG: reverse transcriptase N-terminal domain-containing protein [Clostridiaceae bacterium]|nr:reverse transcriptase N-terminal domain-containing protein [Clostridiaceae bacterium]